MVHMRLKSWRHPPCCHSLSTRKRVSAPAEQSAVHRGWCQFWPNLLVPQPGRSNLYTQGILNCTTARSVPKYAPAVLPRHVVGFKIMFVLWVFSPTETGETFLISEGHVVLKTGCVASYLQHSAKGMHLPVHQLYGSCIQQGNHFTAAPRSIFACNY